MVLHVEIRERKSGRPTAWYTQLPSRKRSNLLGWVVGPISKSRNELPETKASQVFEQEYRRKRSGYQKQLEEMVKKLWKQDRLLRNTEERISDAIALFKELKAEVAATTSGYREIFEQYNRSCREWRAEELGWSGLPRPPSIKTGRRDLLGCPTFPYRFCLSRKPQCWPCSR